MSFIANAFKKSASKGKDKQEADEDLVPQQLFTEWSEDDVADMDMKELRAELNKRGLDVRGKPRVLRKRLNVAIRKQKEERLEEEAALEQQRMHEVFQEAAGSVYSVGRNNLGQLGLHDKKDRRKFTHVKDLWGGNVDKIFAGDSGVSFAIDYKQDVYGWGGGGVGPIGTLGPFKEKMPKSGPIRRAHVYRITQKRRSKWFVHPKLVDSLDGEELVQIASSEGHCAAVSVGGDCFTWGDNTYCQLGLRSTLAASALPPSSSSSASESDSDDDVLGHGDGLSARGPLSRKPSRQKPTGVSHGPASHGKAKLRSLPKPPKKLSRVQLQRMHDTRKHVPTSQLVDLPVGEYAQQVAVGSHHTVCLTRNGRIFSWGLGSDGQLGLGVTRNTSESAVKPSVWLKPALVRALNGVKVREVACGANHCLCASDKGVFSWGAGDGGKLGHGDCKMRTRPTLVSAFKRIPVVHVYAARFYSMVIAAVPPLINCGWVMSFGSGHHGQLGQGLRTRVLVPTVMQTLRDQHVLAKYLACGTYHCALCSTKDELYTWGSNDSNCLGRQTEREYDATPAKVKVFDVIVDRNPRGAIKDIAVGRGFTLVATLPYQGPDEDEVDRMQEEEVLREEAEKRRERLAAARELSKKLKIIGAAPSKRLGLLCDKCADTTKCAGFEPHLLRPNVCKLCGHLARVHSTINPLLTNKDIDDLEEFS